MRQTELPAIVMQSEAYPAGPRSSAMSFSQTPAERDAPVLISPVEQITEHSRAQQSKRIPRHPIVRPPHDGDEVQHTKEPLPGLPIQTLDGAEEEAVGQGTSVDGGREGDEVGQGCTQGGQHAFGQGAEHGGVALRVSNESDLL